MHGVHFMSSYGYVFPNRKEKDNWLQEVAFFEGKMLKHPKAFALINKYYLEANSRVTPEIQTLINMLDFNPHTEDFVQYYWYDGENLMIPTGEWKWPMADYSCVFDNEGRPTKEGKNNYYGWSTDYNMYTYDENKIICDWKSPCVEV